MGDLVFMPEHWNITAGRQFDLHLVVLALGLVKLLELLAEAMSLNPRNGILTAIEIPCPAEDFSSNS